MKKTLLLSLPFGMSARNFLRSAFYSTIKERVRLIIATPLCKDPAFLREFAAPGVTFVNFAATASVERRLLERVVLPVQAHRFCRQHPIRTLVMLRDYLKESNPWRSRWYSTLGNTIGRSDVLTRLLERSYERSLRNPEIDVFLKKEKVDFVFLTHGYVQTEVEVAVTAKAQGIPIVCMVHSWDNLTSKSGLRQITNANVGRLFPAHLFDRVLVWNEILAAELRDLYAVANERIFIAGIPQFDSYPTLRKSSSRDEFFRSIGADSSLKTIFYAATGGTLIHDQTRVVKILVDAVTNRTFKEEVQLLIRSHPGFEFKEWKSQFASPRVHFQSPATADRPVSVSEGWDPDPQHALALPEALSHCDVFVNGMSTTAIEAAVFDKPIVCVGFDGDAANNFRVRQYYENTHYDKLVKTGGLRIAWNAEELIDNITAYLRDPGLDAEGRERIRQQQCYTLDGGAGRRIAEFILSRMEASR